MEDALTVVAKRLELVREFEHIIYTQLRSMGVVLHDDAGNWMRPGGGGEARVVHNMARAVAQHHVDKLASQTPVAASEPA